MKLKSSQVRETRLTLLAQQGNTCALCGNHLEQDQAVLDHCHSKGHIRGAIHRSCNTGLGKIENAAKRYKIDLDAFAQGLFQYLSSKHDLIHPTFFTPTEKVLRAKVRAKRKAKSKKIS